MSFPQDGLADFSNYRPPKPVGKLELKIDDQWRARWEQATALPPGTPVDYGYVLVCMDGKGYVCRKRGSEEVWRTPEGSALAGEKPGAFAKRIAKEMLAATAGTVDLIGYLDCRATSHNRDYPKDAAAVRPVYLVVAKQVKDLGPGASFERRRLPINEYSAAIRIRYPEFEAYLSEGVQRYAVLHARDQLAAR